MSTAFQAKGPAAQDRQLKVQSVCIPFTVTASATASAVVLGNDETSVLYLRSEGVDYITAEVTALGDTASFSVAPDDSDGIMNLFVVVGEQVAKICQANVIDRVNGGSQPCKLGSSTGLSSLGNMMLTMDSTINLSTTNAALCLEVDYIVDDGN